MKEVIYLVVSRHKVEKMTKSLPSLSRGQIPVKLTVTVAENAFREPVIEREVEIIDWREGLDIGDVDLTEHFITEAEAERIRRDRREHVAAMLRELGWKVEPPEPEEPDAPAPE